VLLALGAILALITYILILIPKLWRAAFLVLPNIPWATRWELRRTFGVTWYAALRATEEKDFQAFTIFFIHIILLPREALKDIEKTDFKMRLYHELGHRFGGYYFIFFCLMAFFVATLTASTIAFWEAPSEVRLLPFMALSLFVGFTAERTHHIAEYDADYKAFAAIGQPFTDFLVSRVKRERFMIAKSKAISRRNKRMHPPFSDRVASLDGPDVFSSWFWLKETLFAQALLHAPAICAFLVTGSADYFNITSIIALCQIAFMIGTAIFYYRTLRVRKFYKHAASMTLACALLPALSGLALII